MLAHRVYRPARQKQHKLKVREELGWEPKVSFEELIQMMVEADMAHLKLVHNL